MFLVTDRIYPLQKDKGHENPHQETDVDKILYQRVNELDPEQRKQHDQESVIMKNREFSGLFHTIHLCTLIFKIPA